MGLKEKLRMNQHILLHLAFQDEKVMSANFKQSTLNVPSPTPLSIQNAIHQIFLATWQ